MPQRQGVVCRFEIRVRREHSPGTANPAKMSRTEELEQRAIARHVTSGHGCGGTRCATATGSGAVGLRAETARAET
eukprot:2853182-Rhodomonas_salina.4